MKTKIGWCDYSLNPGIFGCSPKGPECLHCYAAKMAHRQVAMKNYPDGITKVTDEGVKWTGKVILGDAKHINQEFAKLPARRQGRVFVTSMADLFHEMVPYAWILAIHKRMAAFDNLTFMVLTKRAERIPVFQVLYKERFPNVYYGITGGTQESFDRRWHYLRVVEAPALFVSIEPLLSRVVLPQELLDMGSRIQVIWGGERDAHARVMKPADARAIRGQLAGTGVRRYFKQWGTFLPCSQMIPGVHMAEDGNPGRDDRFIKVTGSGYSDILDGQTFHEHLDLA